MRKFILPVATSIIFFLLAFFLCVYTCDTNKIFPGVKEATSSGTYVPGYSTAVSDSRIIFISNADLSTYKDDRVLSIENAPNLFSRAGDYFTVESLSGLDSIFLVKNIVSDHGGYADSYGVVYDPKNNKILYESKKLLQENISIGYIT